MTALPKGWSRARLADVAEVRLGRQRSPDRATGERMRPYLRAANMTWQGLDISDVKEMAFTERESETYELKVGDLLLGEASGSPGEVGKPAQYRGQIEGCCFQNTLLRVRLPVGFVPDFYEHFFREQALSGRFAAGSRGVGIHHLGASALSDWSVPVPPTLEQERIVTAIEEAFSKLDAGEEGLRTVRQRLKRMRDAVLAAAVTGRLVPQDPTDTSASKFLADLGVESIDGAQGLPAGWARTTVGAIATVGTGTTPSRSNSDYWTGGTIPWISSALLNEGTIKAAAEFVTPLALKQTSLRSWPAGTLLVAMYGEGKTRGTCAELAIDATCNQACAAICLPAPLWEMRAFLRIVFDSAYLENRRLASGGVQPNLNLGLVRTIQVRMPPIDEQQRIVSEAERQFSFIDACEQAVDAALARSRGLRRSILKAAFEGRLAPQNPSDEPASVLLDRIRSDREISGAVKSGRGRKKVEAS